MQPDERLERVRHVARAWTDPKEIARALGVRPAEAGRLVRASSEFGDSEYLESVRSHIGEIIALDNRSGRADLVKLSTRFFRTLHDHLGSGTYDPRLESELNSAAGELAEVAAFSSAEPVFA